MGNNELEFRPAALRRAYLGRARSRGHTHSLSTCRRVQNLDFYLIPTFFLSFFSAPSLLLYQIILALFSCEHNGSLCSQYIRAKHYGILIITIN